MLIVSSALDSAVTVELPPAGLLTQLPQGEGGVHLVVQVRTLQEILDLVPLAGL